MRKLLLSVLVLCGLALAGVYFFIPSTIIFSKVAYIKVNANAADKYIYDESKWSKWWPADTEDSLHYTEINVTHPHKKYYYTVSRKMPEGINILIEHDKKSITTFLHVIAIKFDSVALEWSGELPASFNPFKRISNYMEAKGMQHNMGDIVQSAKTFLEKNEDVYGLRIFQEKVKDTILISTKNFSANYPTTEKIYDLIKSLKGYILLNGATETNYPMLSVIQDSGHFKIMVAIPINKIIPQNEKFILKRMVPGKILVTEITGGMYTADNYLKQLETFMEDYHLQSPAIPFQSLITDRSKEPDTLKWITKIYYPVY